MAHSGICCPAPAKRCVYTERRRLASSANPIPISKLSSGKSQALSAPVPCYIHMAKSVKKNAGEAFHCPLCERSGDFLKPSKHHLVPKSRDGEVTADICADCHRQLHALFTLAELEREYSTIEALKASPAMQKWTRWAAKQCGGRVAVRTSHAKRNSYQKDKIYGAV